MPLYPDYCSTAELKAWLNKTDSNDDTKIDLAVTAASRAIDHFCGRQFGTHTSASTRYFTADSSGFVKTFDIATTTSLAVAVDLDDDGTYEQVLTINTDFRLVPRNAAGDSRPWTGIEITQGSAYSLPLQENGVEVTARWGWSAVPSAVKLAALIQSDIAFKRREMGPDAADYTATSKYLDRDVQMLLRPYRRQWGVVR